MSTTGEVLKQLRKERGLTLQTVADQIGVSASFLHCLENGKRKNPSLQVASKLADFYAIDMNTLTGMNEEERDELAKNIEIQQAIEEEIYQTIAKMKEGLDLFNQDYHQSKKQFVEVQKSLLYVQSLF